MKKSVYLDTTIISYFFDKREDLKYPCAITRQWWEEESPNYDIFTSLETVVELSKGNYPRKSEMLTFASKIEQLEPVEEIKEVAFFYIKNKLMPNDIMGDAIHLAYTSYYKIDFLLTWNCNHLANANKKKHINIINTKLGIFTPELITPLELFTEK